MGDHDRGYRLLFQHPEMVEDLLRGFVHESWIDDLDFSSLQHLPEIHVSDKLHRRETDMVWRLRYRGEDWLYVYILLEFQSTVDPFMALRVLVYVSLLAQRLKRQGLLVKRKLLPPMLPLVLYNGDVELREKVPTLEELRAMLQEKTHKTWAEMWQEDAEKKGMRKGRLQGRIELLEEQLESKFGALDETTRSRLHEATSEDLLRWGTRVLKAERLDEVFT